MVRLLPIASGKGGVGKSVIAANLGIALARAGRTVVLVDLDLGASNLHTFLGIRNKHAGIADMAHRRERSLAELLVETGRDRLWFVPGDGMIPGAANLEWFAKKRVLKELAGLPADYAVLDLGAGSSYNVVDYFLSAPDGIVVLRPEITSVLNAYSLLKTAAFRTMLRCFPEKHPARSEMWTFAATRGEGAERSFAAFARELAGHYPDEGAAALARLSSFAPRALMNMAGSEADAVMGERLRGIAARKLGVEPALIGFLPDDPLVPASLSARAPIAESDPESPFARAISGLAAFIENGSGPIGRDRDRTARPRARGE